MPRSLGAASPEGQRVVEIFQDTARVAHSGLLYAGKERLDQESSQKQRLEEIVSEYGVSDLTRLIVEKLATYPANMRLDLSMLAMSRYFRLQNEALTDVLGREEITVRRRRGSTPYALSTELEGKLKPVRGVIAATLLEPQVEIGRLSLEPLSIEAPKLRAYPLDSARKAQLNIGVTR